MGISIDYYEFVDSMVILADIYWLIEILLDR